MKKSLFILLSLGIGLAAVSCGDDNIPPDEELQEGIILYLPPPDNCNDFIIWTEGNIMYKPASIDRYFEVDSMLIRFAFDETEALHNCGFGGSIPVIDLTYIEER